MVHGVSVASAIRHVGGDFVFGGLLRLVGIEVFQVGTMPKSGVAQTNQRSLRCPIQSMRQASVFPGGFSRQWWDRRRSCSGGRAALG